MKRQLLGFLTALLVIPSVAQVLPMDYSYCGYHRSEQPIPALPVVTYVQPTGGDDSRLVQQAIDYVSRQKPDKLTGLRGAVLLGEGRFTLSEPLRIRTSGVVLRGSGRDKTVLRKTGYDRGAAVYIEGTPGLVVTDTLDVSDVRAGATTLAVQGGTSALTAGSRIVIWRPSTQEWIELLGCQSFGGGKRMGYWAWHPGDVDLRWHRTVITCQLSSQRHTLEERTVNCQLIELDAPLTCNIEQCWGGAKAIVYEQKGLVSESGVENLTLESDYDTSLPMDDYVAVADQIAGATNVETVGIIVGLIEKMSPGSTKGLTMKQADQLAGAYIKGVGATLGE